MNECKNCEYCNLYDNVCLVDNQKCYKNGERIHAECDCFRGGTGGAEGYADKSGLAYAT